MPVLSKLKEIYPRCTEDLKKSTASVSVLRADIKDGDEAERFMQNYSAITNTQWIVYYCNSDPKRNNFSKTWICQHSKRHKHNNSKRNADCNAKIIIIIKKITKRTKENDKFLKSDPPLACEIKISFDHSHNTTSAESQRMLRVSEKVRTQFFKYFSDGMSPIEAIRFHEDKFLFAEDYMGLANAAINPTHNQAYYIFNCWRNEHLGDSINPFEKLIEKIPIYESNGTTVKYFDGELWAILLVTPIMKRNHVLSSSKEIVFLDSTSSCEANSSSVTILLSATKVGALPLAVVIHASQSMENYQNAFQLLKENFPSCFGEEDHPEIFMTDDSSAEKGALREVWPVTNQLLCHFHVAQAEWRWIFSNITDSKDDRTMLMKLFQAVMYASSERELEVAVSNLLSKGNKYPNFIKRFHCFYERKKEWVLLFRKDLITRQHNTNNFCEATIRILKDVVLSRTRAFNVVALCEFFIGMMEDYYTKKLLEFSNSRRLSVGLLFENIRKKSSTISLNDFLQVQEDTFEVKGKCGVYVINCDIGTCSCPAGLSGAFCKHQCALMMQKKIKLPNAPPISEEDKYELARLALGEKCPARQFYCDFKKVTFPPEDDASGNAQHLDIIPECSVSKRVTSSKIITDSQRKQLVQEFEKLKNLAETATFSEESAKRLINSLKKVETSDELRSLYVVKKQRAFQTRKIKVQPTSIARRIGLVRSSRRIPAGRPIKGLKTSCKKKRNLSFNISKNQSNAKSHGRNH